MNKINTLINNFSTNNLIAFLRSSIPSFKPEDDELDHLFPEGIYDKYQSIVKIGEAIIDNDDLIVIASKTNEPLTERTGKRNQYEIAKTILKHEVKDASLFVFYDDEGNFRFSFVKANYLGTKRDFTDFKRYTYFITPSQTNKTFITQVGGCNFNSLDEIIQAFSVEPLNKQFYQDIAKSFYGLIGGKVKIGSKNVAFDTSLKLPSTPADTNRKVYQEFAVRLIGRTIFCWFLKSKKSENSIPLVPKSWLSSETVVDVNNQQHNYYHSVLEKLFFLVLNKKQNDRKDYELPNEHELIPFLNGGLFEAQTDDFFPTNGKGIHQISFDLKIPNQWFIELFEVLEQYNFTIDENSIYDAEVSIDPEMLGTIFENLLAEIDPDTEKSARKATGSFYTPREIVDYMVEQSLVQYLKNKVSIENEEQLLELFKEGGSNTFEPTETKKILETLSNVKILDPACGSGAFPMGALHKIIIALQKLDPDASWWKQKQIDTAKNAIVKQYLKEKFNTSNSDYARKLGVIQNSIYGVDIQPIASEISKLRSFLSLVIDETIDDNAINRGIWPLPNLEFKFVTANALIGLEEKQQAQGAFDFGQTDKLQDQLKSIRNQYLQAYGDTKAKLKKDFEEVQNRIFKQEIASDVQNKRALQLASWKPFSNESNTWFDPYWMYGVKTFDIVIGNPPYIDSETMVNTGRADFREYLVSKFSFARGNWDIYIPFMQFGFNTLTDSGVISYITPDKWISKSFGKVLRESLFFNLFRIVLAGRDVFETANVDALITFFSKSKQEQILSYEIENKDNFKLVNYFDSDELKSSFSYDLFFSRNIKLILNLEKNHINLSSLSSCENACATSDAYKLKEFIEELEKENFTGEFYKIINTGTIGKYVSKWGEKEMKYLGDKILKPVVQKKVFSENFKNTYFDKSNQKKIIIKGLTLLDGCLDLNGNIIPGKSTLVLCDEDKELLKFLSGIINSRISIFLLKEKFASSSYNGGVNFNKQMINELLIPRTYESVYDGVIKKVEKIISCIKNEEFDDVEKIQQDIDLIFYKNFYLKFEQVKIIDPEFNLTQEAYENYQIN